MDKKEKARRARLWKCYRWTPEMYDELFRLQNGQCAICGRTPKNAPLQIDHEHFKITTIRTDVGWQATTCIKNEYFFSVRKTKKEAIETLRSVALAFSVRGLLCPGRHRGCNRLLGRVDNIVWLGNAKNYLENPPAKKILDRQHPSVVASENQLEKN